ncbi:arginase, partial [Piscirickettsia salmonis]
MQNTATLPPHVTLIGAPTDIGAGARGASMGPEALRVAGIGPVIEAQGF